MRGDELEKYLSHELRVVNRSLPRTRKSLKTLLEERYPHVPTRDGGAHMFRRKELLTAAEILGDEAEELLLPIVLEFQVSAERTYAVVRDPVAAKLIARILGLPEETPIFVYPVQLRELRRRIGSLITYAFLP